MNCAGGPASYGVTPLARRQLADKLSIPYAYFERMRENQPVLLDRNVNTWLQSDDDRRMIRTLDGNVRAVLSDRYRRLDNYDLAESVLPILQQLPDVRFESVELTDTRMYIKCITPQLKVEMAPGDIVQAGVVISNSEVGQGTLSVQPLLYRLVCRNGLIASDRSLRKTHVGRALGSDESIMVFKDDTLQADDKAFFRDMVHTALMRAGARDVKHATSIDNAVETLGRQRPFPGRRLAILANGRGVGAIAVDRLMDLGGSLAGLSGETRARLAAAVPGTTPEAWRNPVDIGADADGPRTTRTRPLCRWCAARRGASGCTAPR